MALPILGFAISLFITSGLDAATIDMIPRGPTLYYAVGQPATVSFTATLDDEGNEALGQASTVGLRRFSVLVAKYGPIRELLLPNGSEKARERTIWPGVVNLSVSNPQSNVLQGSFTLQYILDGNYSCQVEFFTANPIKAAIQVLTTRPPDGIFITSGNQAVGREAPVVPFADVRLNCSVINSKPRYDLFLEAAGGLSKTSTWVNDSNGVTNSSISLVFTAFLGINGTRVTCSGVPTLRLSGFPSLTATAEIRLTYGPTDYSASVSRYLRTVAEITCELKSYPSVAVFEWTQDDKPIACTARTCVIKPNGAMSQLRCQGSNPISLLTATGIITVTWRDGSEKLVEGSSTAIWVPILTIGLVGAVVLTVMCILKSQKDKHPTPSKVDHCSVTGHSDKHSAPSITDQLKATGHTEEHPAPSKMDRLGETKRTD